MHYKRIFMVDTHTTPNLLGKFPEKASSRLRDPDDTMNESVCYDKPRGC
jgi:hypothetical protein